MVQISKQQFQEMFSMGILKGNNRANKGWIVICPNKKARRKKHYISRDTWLEYLKNKN